MVTSVNLGAALVSEDAKRYATIKAAFGSLCGLLVRFPNRFALVNNHPLNHVVVIGDVSNTRRAGRVVGGSKAPQQTPPRSRLSPTPQGRSTLDSRGRARCGIVRPRREAGR